MGVTMVPVENSNNVKAYGYDAVAEELHMQFLGGSLYVFAHVPASIYSGLEAAKSKGSFFHANIKGQYPHRKVEQKKTE